MGFRENTEAHARNFWNKVCEDGQIVTFSRIIHLGVLREKPPKHPAPEWDTVFSSDLSQPGEELFFVRKTNLGVRERSGVDHKSGVDDCTHFVSECLKKGGLPNAPAENSTPRMVEKLRLRGDTKTLALTVGQSAAERVVNGGVFKKGDVVAYWSETAAPKPNYSHMGVLVEQSGIACHSRCRYNEPWPLGNHYKYTLIHFSFDDRVPHVLGQSLEGWWKVNWRGTSYYYLYEKTGKVRYTTLKPSSPMQRTATFQGTGYWFDQGGERHTIYWTSTGSVEKFWFGPNKRVLQGFWNDGDPLLGEKL